jgi:short-subunit dehydrogenase
VYNATSVVVITGGSSGIGQAAAKLFAQKGHIVYNLSRHPGSLTGVTDITCDISDETQVNEAVKRVINETGRIDILVNNAGFGIAGAIEEETTRRMRSLFDVNFFGACFLIRAVLPYMRAARKGRIINISSAASIFPIPYQAFYSAGKAAINSITMSLANEVRKFGITVCALMPGDVSTGFTAARRLPNIANSPYNPAQNQALSAMVRDEQNGMSPEYVAKHIINAAFGHSGRQLLFAVGFKYRFFSFLGKILPCRLINWILGKMYG